MSVRLLDVMLMLNKSNSNDINTVDDKEIKTPKALSVRADADSINHDVHFSRFIKYFFSTSDSLFSFFNFHCTSV